MTDEADFLHSLGLKSDNGFELQTEILKLDAGGRSKLYYDVLSKRLGLAYAIGDAAYQKDSKKGRLLAGRASLLNAIIKYLES